MASSKRIGFFWGEDKLTLVEFDKNTALKAVSTPLGSKNSIASPFSSNLTEEIQITAVFQKLLQDNQITGGSFYVSLPMKEIILRSFAIPFVKQDDVQNAIKFEARKYLPIDIQSLNYVYYMVPFMENKVKRYQVLFFAVRKEFLGRYQRVFKQINVAISYCEPSVVSLAKFLLFKKEITPSEHIVFLNLEKTLGSICFIDKGVPQFIREFSLGSNLPSDEMKESSDALNLKIVNEVANSFDFYARQFNGEPLEKMLVAAEDIGPELLNLLEKEIKLKIKQMSPIAATGPLSEVKDVDSIYALGACVTSPVTSLAGFNFIEEKEQKSIFKSDLMETIGLYKEILFICLICLISLVGVYVFFQVQLKVTQQQYDQLSAKQGAFAGETADGIQSEIQQNTDKLASYKNIRLKSDMVLILLRIASHLPKGAYLKDMTINYNKTDFNDNHVAIEMDGDVYKEDSNDEIKAINQIYSDIKNDKELAVLFNKGVTVSLNLEELNGRQVASFTILCS